MDKIKDIHYVYFEAEYIDEINGLLERGYVIFHNLEYKDNPKTPQIAVCMVLWENKEPSGLCGSSQWSPLQLAAYSRQKIK